MDDEAKTQWLEVHKESSDHAKVVKTAIERLKHLDKCLEEKGYMDFTLDVKGRKPEWRKVNESMLSFPKLRRCLRRYVIKQLIFSKSAHGAEAMKPLAKKR